MSLRRILAALAVLAASTVAPARPAAADPARPTNDRSAVVAVEPAVPGVTVDVVGGDAFLRVRVADGHRLEIPGYTGEPYLRIDDAGRVERNERSPATWLNSARYGPSATSPPGLDSDAEPEWATIGTNGEAVWHDHRIHAMGGPPQRTWEVEAVVDGSPVRIRGELVRLGAPNPWPWRAYALAWGVAVLVGLHRWRRWGLAVVAVIVAALGAGALGMAEGRALPGEAGSGVSAVVLPAIALAAALAGAVLARGRAAWAAPPLIAGAGVALVVWAWTRVAVFDHAILLTGLPDALERAIVATALGAGVAAIVAGGVASVLRPRLAAAADRG